MRFYRTHQLVEYLYLFLTFQDLYQKWLAFLGGPEKRKYLINYVRLCIFLNEALISAFIRLLSNLLSRRRTILIFYTRLFLWKLGNRFSLWFSVLSTWIEWDLVQTALRGRNHYWQLLEVVLDVGKAVYRNILRRDFIIHHRVEVDKVIRIMGPRNHDILLIYSMKRLCFEPERKVKRLMHWL